MLLTESQLRTIIRSVLLEGFRPEGSDETNKLYQVIEIQPLGSKTRHEGLYIAGDDKMGYYIALDKDEVQKYKGGFKKVPKANVSYVIKAFKKNKTKGKLDDAKVKELISQNRLIFVPDSKFLFEPKSSDETAGYVSFLQDSGIEAGAAISGIASAAFTAAGMLPIAAAIEAVGNGFNVADFFNKLDQKNFLGAVFAALGLVPGGDSIGLLNKIGKLDDVFPAALADDIAREIIKLVEGDNLNTINELVNAYVEDREIDRSQINPFISKIVESGKELAKEIVKIKDQPIEVLASGMGA